MGPDWRARHVARKDVTDRVGSVKAGEVPVCYDNTNPRVYRRLVCDWIAFQDLSDDSSRKRLTRGQQILAIITNIRGNAGLRMEHIPGMLRKDMTREEFMKMVDYILDIVDPVDRESSFLQTAKAWKDLMQKVYQKGQTYDKYWIEYSALCLQYAYSHGESAQTPGIQELLALLCVLNARLPRAEFSIVLQASMRFQKDQLDPQPTRAQYLVGPASASRALSHYSGGVDAGAVAETSAATHRDDTTAQLQVQPQASGSAQAESSRHASRSKEQTQSSVHENLSICNVELQDMDTRAKQVLRTVEQAFASMTGWTAVAPDSTSVSAVSGSLRAAAGQITAMVTSIESTKGFVEELLSKARDNDLSYSVSQLAVAQIGQVPAFSTSGGRASQSEPLITLEAVRMALRRIDHGDLATHAGRTGDNRVRNTPDTLAGATARSGLAGKTEVSARPDVKCWVCEGNHFYYENDKCKKAHEAKRARDPKAQAGRKKPAPPTQSALSSVRWADPPGKAFTGMSRLHRNRDGRQADGDEKCMDNIYAIVDGGAAGSVIGISNYVSLCDEMGLKPKISKRRTEDYESHAFGTEKNHSEPQQVVGRCKLPLPIADNILLRLSCLVVDGNVPLVIGKDALVEHKSIESHDGNWVSFEIDGHIVRLSTRVSKVDGHSRVTLCASGLQKAVAMGMIQNISKDATQISIVRRIHQRTHLHPRSVEKLLKRANKWKPEMSAELAQVQGECTACMRSGDPPPANKFSMSRIHLSFNTRIYVDVMYWGQELVLHVVDYATSYSEVAPLDSRDLMGILRTVSRIWLLRHGEPSEIFADAELDKGMARRWAKGLGIKLVALPARRHNKAGPVERKHRVIKDALERLENDAMHKDLRFPDRLAISCFISNILYGNRTASSFELVRGYTPSIAGTGTKILPTAVRAAHEEMVARRLLAKVLKARPASAKSRRMRIGDEVFVLLPGGKRPRGEWVKRRVRSVREDYSVIVGSGRNRRVIAPEDVRTLPKSPMAALAVDAELGISEDGIETARIDDGNISLSDGSDGGSSSSSSYDEDDGDLVQGATGINEDGLGSPVRDTSVQKSHEGTELHHTQSIDDIDAKENIEDQPDESEAVESSTAVPLRRSKRSAPPPERLNLLTNPIDRNATEQVVLGRVYATVGNTQFMSREMSIIPGWMFDQAQRAELDKNWFPNIRRVRRFKVPDGGNVISSHFVYKIKIENDNGASQRYALKARLCVHGNRDDERESLRTDAAVVSQNGFRLLYSTAAAHGMILGKADIRGAYTQSGSARREVFVQPPPEMRIQREVWLLTATMYGLVSAGRKWQRASDSLMINGLGLSTVWGLPQLFCRDAASVEGTPSDRGTALEGRDICLMIAKYVDDLLVAGRNVDWLHYAHDGISRVFELSSWAYTPSILIVNACEVMQTPQDVTLSMHAYLKEIEVIGISTQRRKEPEAEVSRIEERRLKSLAGKLGYLGVTVSPFAAFAASFIQQLVPSMRVAGMKKVNALVRDVLRRQPVLSYLQPSAEENAQAMIVVFSDAGFPHGGALKKVAQEGCIVGISFGVSVGSIFHTVIYQSRKQRRVATSTGEAETIAAVTAVGCARALQDSILSLTGRRLGITLVVDSKGLHRCLATQSLPRDRGMSADVHRLREEYESGAIADIVWVPGVSNPADGLTKPITGSTADLLEKMLVTGRLTIAIDDRREYGPALREEL